ncbi:MAG: 4'-phosphopantetheinyl transferase superfamily protein [Pseudoxanthomonas sp.]
MLSPDRPGFPQCVSAAAPGLGQAFVDALPSPGWMDMAHSRTLVAFFELGDWNAWLPQAGRLLDEAESGRVARRRRSGDRDGLTLAYALHRLFLGGALGLAPADVPLGRDERGCPRLQGLVMGTSLSHAGEYLAMAFCPQGPVGVDIEPVARAAGMDGIAAQVCHPAESACSAGDDARARSERLLSLWVRKEAFLKAAGIGLEREMNTFRAPEGMELPLGGPHGGWTCLHMLDAGPDAVAAVAIPPRTKACAAWFRPGRARVRAKA